MSSELNFKYDKANISLRRNRTLELLAKGYQQNEIAQVLGVSTATTSLDCQWIRCQAQEQLEHHISDVIPYHYVLAVEGFRNVLRTSNSIVENNSDDRIRLQALTVISNTCSKLLEIDLNGPTIGMAVSRAKEMETNKFILKEMEQNPISLAEEEEPEVKPEDQKEDDDNE
jgi:hypothetical protein